MTDKLSADMKVIRQLTYEAYLTSGRLLALLEAKSNGEQVAQAMERMSYLFEKSVIELRNICERNRPPGLKQLSKPALPDMSIAGSVEVNSYGWLHIRLNALLPHCRFQTPLYLTRTIIRLLDEYENSHHVLPRYEDAILIIDEHCDLRSRMVYDPDNKGWKAIPNAIKGRVVRDDDQFILELALLSTVSDRPACHIYILPQADAGEFFSLRNDRLI